MKKIILVLAGLLSFLVSAEANATTNLALGKIQAVKVFDRAGNQYIQVIFAADAVVYATGCKETFGTANVAVAYITYASHPNNNIVNMWLSELMSAYATGTAVRITSLGGQDPCEIDMVAMEDTNI